MKDRLKRTTESVWRRRALWLPVAAIGVAAAVIAYWNRARPVRSWLRDAAEEVYTSTAWDSFGSTLVAGVLSALVAVLTVHLTERRGERRALRQQSRDAAAAMTRSSAKLWSVVGHGVVNREAQGARDEWVIDYLVAKVAIRDLVVVEQMGAVGRSLESWLGNGLEASRRFQEDSYMEPDTGHITDPDYKQSVRESFEAFETQHSQLLDDLARHRQGKSPVQAGRKRFEPVTLVNRGTRPAQ